MSVKLRDVVEELRKQGKDDEADFYQFTVILELMMKHGLSDNTILNLSIDKIEELYQRPPTPEKYRGWNLWWGEAIEDADNR